MHTHTHTPPRYQSQNNFITKIKWKNNIMRHGLWINSNTQNFVHFRDMSKYRNIIANCVIYFKCLLNTNQPLIIIRNNSKSKYSEFTIYKNDFYTLFSTDCLLFFPGSPKVTIICYKLFVGLNHISFDHKQNLKHFMQRSRPICVIGNV